MARAGSQEDSVRPNASLGNHILAFFPVVDCLPTSAANTLALHWKGSMRARERYSNALLTGMERICTKPMHWERKMRTGDFFFTFSGEMRVVQQTLSAEDTIRDARGRLRGRECGAFLARLGCIKSSQSERDGDTGDSLKG